MVNMKKILINIACLSSLLLTIFLTQAAELHLYAGAGLKVPVEKIVNQFMQDTGHKVTIEYGGSGQILTRFELTKTGDIFIPGSAEYIDKLADKGNIIVAYPIVLHTPVLVVRKDKARQMTTIKQLAESSLQLGMGDPKSIALGISGEKLLMSSGYGKDLQDKVIVRATTIKQLLIYLLNGDIDAAVIGRSDAIKHQDKLLLLPTPQGTPEEIVTVAALKTTQHPEVATELVKYFASPKGVKIFVDEGFLPVN